MIKVFLCLRELSMLKQLFEFEKEINIVGISTTMLENTSELKNVQPDMLILQYTNGDDRFIHFFEELGTDEELNNIKILPLFQDLDSEVVHLLLQYDIHEFLVEPYDTAQLMEAIRAETRKHEMVQGIQYNKETLTSLVMSDLGLPLHLKGFAYIKTAVLQVLLFTGGIRITMGYLYSEVARIHKTTAVRVEKCIRTAIKFAFRNSPEKICIYNAKPTSSQIIFYVSEHVRMYDTE